MVLSGGIVLRATHCFPRPPHPCSKVLSHTTSSSLKALRLICQARRKPLPSPRPNDSRLVSRTAGTLRVANNQQQLPKPPIDGRPHRTELVMGGGMNGRVFPGLRHRQCAKRLLTLRTFGRTIVAMGKTRQTKKFVLPTSAEFGLLQILWRIGEGTIDDIVEASGQNPHPNYKTVQTLLRIMERKGQ